MGKKHAIGDDDRANSGVDDAEQPAIVVKWRPVSQTQSAVHLGSGAVAQKQSAIVVECRRWLKYRA
jgi:hypothetical protein